MLGELVRESFPGFDNQSYKFFKDLRSPSKNNKEWFDKNRERYDTYVKEPMKHLIDTLAVEIARIDSDIIVNYKSIFRINRDIRFSKDKTPYKTFVSASFSFHRIKSAEIPGFYFQVDPDEFLFAAGQYSMEPNYLKKIRRFIHDNPERYKSIISAAKFRKRYGKVVGEMLSRLPNEFRENREIEKDKFLSDALMHKQFYVFETHKPDIALSEKIVKVIVDNIKSTYDFTKFLTDAIDS